jgi:hypothetical protein
MNSSRMVHVLMTAIALGSLFVMAHAQSASSSSTDGIEKGNYVIQQSIELGYRWSSISSPGQSSENDAMFNTLVNLHSGPRLLEQSLSLRSLNNTGLLFDDLNITSFGWGGDPNNVARFRVSKNRWYNFEGDFRRDQNFFNYDLLANPLNPSSSVPNLPVESSPHQYQTRRRMSDFSLTLLPDRSVSFRLGYLRNRSEGPSSLSFYEGVPVLVSQPWNVTANQYRVGIDVNLLPRTSLSYTQYLDYQKVDTSWDLAQFATYPLPDGTPVEFGLSFNTAANQPCATPIVGGQANPACNGYFLYSRRQRVRTSIPTEQFGFQSNYFRRVTLLGNATYSSSKAQSPFDEFFNGLVSRTRTRQFSFTGPAESRRLSVTADFAATVRLTNKLTLTDSFRFENFRIPGTWDSTETAYIVPAPATLLSPLGPPTITSQLFDRFVGQNAKTNTAEVKYDVSRWWGVRIGYRFRDRAIRHALYDTGEEPEIFVIRDHTGIIGLWVRPSDKLRVNFETQLTSSDNFLTRISPRQQQQYRFRTQYNPWPWAKFAATINIRESRNSSLDIAFRSHLRNYGFVISLIPNNRLSMDVSYNYTDALQNANICFASTISVVTPVIACPTFDPANPAENPNPYSANSFYNNKTQFGSAMFVIKPLKRLTTRAGYSISSVNGSTLTLNPLQPLGPLAFNYHQPLASLTYDLHANWSLNGYWNYDQYSEKSFAGPTLPRDFHDNRTMLTVRYGF